LNAWPGYVDALSTLLMVIIFVLLVFVLAQAFLSVALSGRDKALDRLNRQVSELSDMLSLERGRSSELRTSIAQLGRELATTSSARDTLAQQLAALRGEQARLTQDRDGLKGERDRLAARLADSELQMQSARARAEALQAQVAEAAKRGDAAAQDAATAAAGLVEARRALAARDQALAEAQAAAAAREKELGGTRTDLAAREKDLTAAQSQLLAMQGALAAAQQELEATKQRVAEMQRQAEAMDRTVKADKETIEARLSDLARMQEQARAMAALRDDLERQVKETAARATTEEERRAAAAAALAEEKKFSDSARAQIALLNQNVEAMRAELARVGAALEASEKAGKEKDTQIVNLGARLNSALAQKVEELQRYRSDFFGRLREVLANRPGIQVVGDRFVFQSEVLFPVGSAELSATGWEQVRALAATLISVSKEIPPDVNWLLRVDGHADRQPVQSGRFASNWELSAARAITVVKLLIAEGVAPNRLAATGFGDNQPLDPADTPEAYAKNRRIEIRLTDR
jgi:chemotaxis protein MotB